MNPQGTNLFLIIGGVVVLGIIAFVVVTLSNTAEPQEKAMMEKETATMEDKGAVMEKEEGDAMMEKTEGDSMMEKGSYESYAPEKLARANDGDVVLFFRASWCPSCRALDADIRANSIPAGLTILDVNYDTETALKQKYGVTMQHTLVQVDANGTLIKKWKGTPTLSSLTAEVE